MDEKHNAQFLILFVTSRNKYFRRHRVYILLIGIKFYVLIGIRFYVDKILCRLSHVRLSVEMPFASEQSDEGGQNCTQIHFRPVEFVVLKMFWYNLHLLSRQI